MCVSISQNVLKIMWGCNAQPKCPTCRKVTSNKPNTPRAACNKPCIISRETVKYGVFCGCPSVPPRCQSAGNPSFSRRCSNPKRNGMEVIMPVNKRNLGLGPKAIQDKRNSAGPSAPPKRNDKETLVDHKIGMPGISENKIHEALDKIESDESSGEEEAVEVDSIASLNNNRQFEGIGDHEYVHFLLRITEDILRQNLYSDAEMQNVFDSHIQANTGRLDPVKMQKQIDYLKIELNSPKFGSSNTTTCVQWDEEKQELVLTECPMSKEPKLVCACLNPDCTHRNDNSESSSSTELPSCKAPAARRQESMSAKEQDFSESGLHLRLLELGDSYQSTSSLQKKELKKQHRAESDYVVVDGPILIPRKVIENEDVAIFVEEKVLIKSPIKQSISTGDEERRHATKYAPKAEGETDEASITTNETALIEKMLFNDVHQSTTTSKTVDNSNFEKIFDYEIDDQEQKEGDGKKTENCCHCIRLSPDLPAKKEPNDPTTNETFFGNGFTEDILGKDLQSKNCYCKPTDHRNGVKIQLVDDDAGEIYVMLEGPVYVPKNIAETKTMPISVDTLGDNALFPQLNDDFFADMNTADALSYNAIPPGMNDDFLESRVNLYQPKDTLVDEDNQMKSVSGEIKIDSNSHIQINEGPGEEQQSLGAALSDDEIMSNFEEKLEQFEIERENDEESQKKLDLEEKSISPAFSEKEIKSDDFEDKLKQYEIEHEKDEEAPKKCDLEEKSISPAFSEKEVKSDVEEKLKQFEIEHKKDEEAQKKLDLEQKSVSPAFSGKEVKSDLEEKLKKFEIEREKNEKDQKNLDLELEKYMFKFDANNYGDNLYHFLLKDATTSMTNFYEYKSNRPVTGGVILGAVPREAVISPEKSLSVETVEKREKSLSVETFEKREKSLSAETFEKREKSLSAETFEKREDLSLQDEQSEKGSINIEPPERESIRTDEIEFDYIEGEEKIEEEIVLTRFDLDPNLYADTKPLDEDSKKEEKSERESDIVVPPPLIRHRESILKQESSFNNGGRQRPKATSFQVEPSEMPFFTAPKVEKSSSAEIYVRKRIDSLTIEKEMSRRNLPDDKTKELPIIARKHSSSDLVTTMSKMAHSRDDITGAGSAQAILAKLDKIPSNTSRNEETVEQVKDTLKQFRTIDGGQEGKFNLSDLDTASILKHEVDHEETHDQPRASTAQNRRDTIQKSESVENKENCLLCCGKKFKKLL